MILHTVEEALSFLNVPSKDILELIEFVKLDEKRLCISRNCSYCSYYIEIFPNKIFLHHRDIYFRCKHHSKYGNFLTIESVLHCPPELIEIVRTRALLEE
jgi:hypothetical protein